VREIRTRTLRDAAGREHRYVATAVPRGEAVRSVRAVGADAGYELREPPSALPCVGRSGWLAVGFLFGIADGPVRPPSGDEQVAAEAAGHRLLVRDAEGDRLCAGIDRLLAEGTDCTLPAVNGEDAYGLAHDGVVAAVLPGEVASVRLPGGRVVPTIEGGYRGRYAGAVRFLLAEVRTSDPFPQYRMLDAAGAPIGSFAAFDRAAFDQSPTGRQLRLASGRGWRITVARQRFGACLFLTMRGEAPVCVDSADAGSDGATAVVGCTPRVAVLTGTLSGETRSVRAVLRGGRTLRARILRIPRRFGGGRAFVLALPRRASMRAIRFDDRSAALPVLPASDQCGYQVSGPAFSEAEIEVDARG
jgi:hypothetical protein